MPAANARLVSVFLKRGPWTIIQAASPALASAALIMNSFEELPDALGRI